MGLRCLSFSLALLALSGAALAQATPELEYRGGTRPFADPLYWLNEGNPDRLPIRERALIPRLGFAGLAPPPDTRQGFTPFAGLAFSHRDNSDPATVSESFLALGLGLAYTHIGRRDQFQADYYIELTSAEGTGGGIDNHGGILSYNLNLTDRDRLTALASYASTTDVQSAPLTGAIAGATTFETSSLQFAYAHDFARRTGFELGVSGIFQSTDQGSTNDADAYALNGRFWYFATPTGRLETSFRLAKLDIGASDFDLQDIDIGYTLDLGPRLAASGSLGLMHTNADGGRTFARLGGNVVTSAQNSRLELALERDIQAIPGLAAPVLTDRLAARWEYRFSDGLLSLVTLENRRLEELSPTGNTTRAYSLDGQLSYALDKQNWVWGRLSLSSERTAGVRTNDTRLTVGFTRNLR